MKPDNDAPSWRNGIGPEFWAMLLDNQLMIMRALRAIHFPPSTHHVGLGFEIGDKIVKTQQAVARLRKSDLEAG